MKKSDAQSSNIVKLISSKAMRARDAAAKALLETFLKQARDRSFIVEYWDGQSFKQGSGDPSFTVRFKDPSAIWRVMKNPLVEFPEAYVGRTIEVDGSLQELVKLSYELVPPRPRFDALKSVAIAHIAPWQRNSVFNAKRNVAHHYDLGNAFFQLWLDELMVYSCAYFETEEDDLDVAQRQKLEYLCNKLELRPGLSLLDIGCGWGALALHAAKVHGTKVLGITLSEQQRLSCLDRLRTLALQDRVDVRLQDYRKLQGSKFDRVVSIGMMEHIGRPYLPSYMKSVGECLHPDGRGVFQWISRDTPGSAPEWIRKRIFPGMYLPTLAEVTSEMAGSGLRVVDVENLRRHYAMTLDCWSARFERVNETVMRMYDERFVRMWRLYLNGSAVAFKTGYLNLWQVTFTRGVVNAGPLTRRGLYEPEAAHRYPDAIVR